MSGFEGYDVARLNSHGAPLSCTTFGERLRITDAEASYLLYFEDGEATFSCKDCELVNNTADYPLLAKSGASTFVGGSLAPNPLYTSNTAGLFAQAGQVTLEGVELGEGAEGNPATTSRLGHNATMAPA